MDLASELGKQQQRNYRKRWKLDFLGPNCNENDVYDVAFKIRMVPSDSIEDSVEKMGRCLGIQPLKLQKNCGGITEKKH